MSILNTWDLKFKNSIRIFLITHNPTQNNTKYLPKKKNIKKIYLQHAMRKITRFSESMTYIRLTSLYGD